MFISQVTKGSATVKARLVAQIEGSPSKEALWSVAYDDDATLSDEQLLESSFGAILSSGSDNESTAAAVDPTPSAPTPAPAPQLTPGQAQTAAATAARKKKGKNGRFQKAVAAAGGEGPVVSSRGRFTDDADKKVVSFSQESAAQSDSSNISSGKRSAREQRTARRSRFPPQTDIVSSQQQTQQQPQHQVANGAINNTASKRRPPVNSGGGKASKKAKLGDEEVVKVPMLTGTLYLVCIPNCSFASRFVVLCSLFSDPHIHLSESFIQYKGLQRRAEFIRKY